jgi:ferredoxin-NADP reductase
VSSGTQADWQPARVVEATEVAHDIRRITIARAPGRRAHPGTHIDVRVELAGGPDLRSYSVVESNDDGSLLTLTVLKTPHSRGGSVFMHGLAPGDSLATTQPLQNFPLRIGAGRYVLLAGGVGITAVVEMARVLKALKADYTLVYAARDRDRMAYATRLRRVHGDRLRLHVDADGSPLDVDELVAGISAGPLRDQTEVYLCGPIRLMDAVRRSWTSAGLPEHNLRFETFGSSGWFEAEEFVVRIPELGVSARVPADSTILDALGAAGVDIMFDCLKGECGLCVVAIDGVTGSVDHRDVFLSAQQKAGDKRLCACVSRVVGAGASGAGAPELTLALP